MRFEDNIDIKRRLRGNIDVRERAANRKVDAAID